MNMKRAKLYLLTAVIALASSFSLALTPITSSAQGLFDAAKSDACKGSQLTQSATNCSGASREVDSLIKSIINILSIVVGVIAVIMLIINGLRFITSGGDSNSITSARNGVIYSIVGLIIVALAQVIIRFVVGKTA